MLLDNLSAQARTVLPELRQRSSVQDGIVGYEKSMGRVWCRYTPGNGALYHFYILDLAGLPTERTPSGRPASHLLFWLEAKKGVLVASDTLSVSELCGELDVNPREGVVVGELLGHLLQRPCLSCSDYLRRIGEVGLATAHVVQSDDALDT